MKRFFTAVKNTTGKALASESNYLNKMSHAHAFNTYNDDDKDINKSLKEQVNQIKIKKNLDNDLLTSKSEAHAYGCIQDDDKEIAKSINEQNIKIPTHLNTGC
jgi:hypothetical protein